MDKENNFKDQLPSNEEEFDLDLYFSEEYDEEWEKEKERQREKWAKIKKIIGTLVAVALLVSGLQLWFYIFNIPSLEFLKVSRELSQEEKVQEYKKAIVIIESDNSKGTGFNISPEGLIVTNQHVVGDEKLVKVSFPEIGFFTGEVIFQNSNLDLALLEIESQELPILSVSEEENWQKFIGEDILFIGNPLAHSQVANVGKITGEVTLSSIDVPVMELSAPVYRGNSGSPVINDDGEVIGVVFATLKSSRSGSNEIRAVAIPSIYLIDALEERQLKK